MGMAVPQPAQKGETGQGSERKKSKQWQWSEEENKLSFVIAIAASWLVRAVYTRFSEPTLGKSVKWAGALFRAVWWKPEPPLLSRLASSAYLWRSFWMCQVLFVHKKSTAFNMFPFHRCSHFTTFFWSIFLLSSPNKPVCSGPHSGLHFCTPYSYPNQRWYLNLWSCSTHFW